MNPDDVVLVALVKSPRDLELAANEHWYRIPARHAPKYFAGAQYLAFYLSRAFGSEKWRIQEYARVRGHELVRRRDLLPDEPDHERADEPYYKLEIADFVKRSTPIVSKRGRRILFLWTTGEKFESATEINDLFHKGPLQDKLWVALKESNLDVERQILIREGRSRYRVDFLVFCKYGRIAVRMNRELPFLRRKAKLRGCEFSETELNDHFEGILKRIKRQAFDLTKKYSERGHRIEHID